MSDQFTINISDYNSIGIVEEAQRLGVETMKFIGSGHSDGNEQNCNSVVNFFELSNGVRVAETNGDPVWEEADREQFAGLAVSCGVTL